MKEPIVINSLNDGIDVKSDPAAISEGGLADCVGFDLTQEGVIKTAGGLADNDISTLLPGGTIQCVRIFYMGATRYILATTAAGLYSNSVLINANFTGRFKGVVFLKSIYLVNSVYTVRFNGTTCYQCGITAPTTVPTITLGDYLYRYIDEFETLTTWAANQVDCTVTAETTIYKMGTQSAHFAVAASTMGYSYVPITLDGTTFVTGETCGDKDYVRFWLYVTSLANLDTFNIYIDVGDGTFTNDYFSYGLLPPGSTKVLQLLGHGKSAEVSPEETTSQGSTSAADEAEFRDFFMSFFGITDLSTTISATDATSFVSPAAKDQVLSYWQRSNLFLLNDATWQEIKIPKSLFLQTGDPAKTWATISAVKIEVTSTAVGIANVYVDDWRFVGGSDLIGDYWFMYSWGRTDSDGNVLHESPPSRDTTLKQFNIIGPVTFDRHPLTYAARPLSADPQVNCGILFAIGGSLTDFWEIAIIYDNTTVTDTLYDIGDTYASRKIMYKNSEPAPAGTDIALFRNKLWLVGDPSYPDLLRSSDILADGTISPESWPTRNAYEPAGSTGSLLNVQVVNKQLVVKGESGEWLIKVLDPTDYLQVGADPVSSLGLLGQDAVLSFETSTCYPSLRGFVESDGNQAKFILPEIAPLIDANIINAKGVNAGLVSYFTYNSLTYGPRTAKIDMFRGKPRIVNLNNIFFDSLECDIKTNVVYGITGGVVVILDEGSTNEATSSTELYSLLKSRVYRRGGKSSWHRMEIVYNTGGIWYRLEVYLDGVLKSSIPFMSTSRTVGNFTFGPISGHDFQFIITGDYSAPGTFSFPMRIF